MTNAKQSDEDGKDSDVEMIDSNQKKPFRPPYEEKKE